MCMGAEAVCGCGGVGHVCVCVVEEVLAVCVCRCGGVGHLRLCVVEEVLLAVCAEAMWCVLCESCETSHNAERGRGGGAT